MCDICYFPGNTHYYGHNVCEDCIKDITSIEHDLIFPYGHWPDLVFYQLKSDPDPFLGIEIECYSDYRFSNLAHKLLINTNGWCWGVDDSSCEEGFEINTQPSTLSWIKDNQKPLNHICHLATHGLSSYHNGCGMHVHVDLPSFKSKLHEYKFIYLFREFPDFIFELSRRDRIDFEEYSKPKDIKNSYFSAHSQNISPDYVRGSAGYSVNNTIEIRIFKGTLRKGSILANLEIVTAAFHFTAENPVKDINPAGLFLYMQSKGDTYINALKLYRKLMIKTLREGELAKCA